MNMIMMMNTFDVWSARTATPCQPVLVKVLRAAPPTLLRIKIQRRSQTNLSAGPCLRQSAFYYALNGTFVALPLTQFELQPNFHMFIYIYVQYTYYQ